MQPWDNQSYLKKDKCPTIGDIISKAESISEPRTKALFILAYLTAGRICELVRYNRNGIKYSSIKRKDIKTAIINERNVLVISIRNEKSRDRHTKDFPIPLDKKENIILFNMLVDYINDLEDDEELFTFNYQRAYKLLNPIDFNPHYIRHIRATHLVTVYDFNEFELTKYMGWSDARPAKHYLELKMTDVLRKL